MTEDQAVRVVRQRVVEMTGWDLEYIDWLLENRPIDVADMFAVRIATQKANEKPAQGKQSKSGKNRP